MKNYEIRINPKEILYGGMILWVIEIKERFYNGRLKVTILFITAFIFFLSYPVVSYLLIGGLLFLVIMDFCFTFFEYKKLSNLHRNKQAEKYFLHIEDIGFSHSLTDEGNRVFTNLWEKYDYFIDVKKRGLLILIDKNGETNLFFQSWMSEEAFSELRFAAYQKIKRKLNNRFV